MIGAFPVRLGALSAGPPIGSSGFRFPGSGFGYFPVVIGQAGGARVSAQWPVMVSGLWSTAPFVSLSAPLSTSPWTISAPLPYAPMPVPVTGYDFWVSRFRFAALVSVYPVMMMTFCFDESGVDLTSLVQSCFVPDSCDGAVRLCPLSVFFSQDDSRVASATHGSPGRRSLECSAEGKTHRFSTRCLQSRSIGPLPLAGH